MRRNLDIQESGTQFLLAIVAMAVLQMVFNFSLPVVITIGGVSVSTWVVLCTNQIAFTFAVFVYFRMRRVDLRDTIRARGRLDWRQALVIFFLSIFTICAFLPLAQIFLQLVGLLGFSASSSFPVAESFGVFVLELIVLGVVPALSEELLLRGAVLSGLKSRNYVFAIFVSALLFSLMHASAQQTVHQFGLGIVLASVFLITGSFWAPVLLHFFNNFISLVVSNYMPAVNNIDLGGWNYLLWAFLVPISLFIIAFLLKILVKLRERQNPIFRIVDETELAAVFDFGGNEEKSFVPVKHRTPANGSVALVQSALRETWQDLASVFKKGGLRGRAQRVNELLYRLDDDCTALRGERVPVTVWLAIAAVGLMWIINFVVALL